MSQSADLLALLSDGRPHEMRSIHRAIGFCRLNSRVSELRGRGHRIECDKTGGQYVYTLIGRPLEAPSGSVPQGTDGTDGASSGSASDSPLTCPEPLDLLTEESLTAADLKSVQGQMGESGEPRSASGYVTRSDVGLVRPLADPVAEGDAFTVVSVATSPGSASGSIACSSLDLLDSWTEPNGSETRLQSVSPEPVEALTSRAPVESDHRSAVVADAASVQPSEQLTLRWVA